MSRVGNRPISIDPAVTVSLENKAVILKSAKGMMQVNVPEYIKVKFDDSKINVSRSLESKEARSQHGLVARLIRNAASGLSSGINKTLDFKGTGYRAKVENGKLILNMGYSHEIVLDVPENIEASVVKNTIIVSGYDAAEVGNFSAEIRAVRPPEVYKGKGIKYREETIRRKDGKVASGGKG